MGMEHGEEVNRASDEAGRQLLEREIRCFPRRLPEVDEAMRLRCGWTFLVGELSAKYMSSETSTLDMINSQQLCSPNTRQHEATGLPVACCLEAMSHTVRTPT